MVRLRFVWSMFVQRTPLVSPPIFSHALVRRGSALGPRAVLESVPELDRVLPRGGLEAGSLVDLHAPRGQGGLELALRVAARLLRAAPGRLAVAVDAAGDLYPPALAQAGVDLERLLVVRPRGGAPRAALACVEEALRSSAVAVVVARLEGLRAAEGHRLRSAARAGGAVGLLVRPEHERFEVSAAPLRLRVARGPEGAGGPAGEVRIEVLRARGASP